MSLDWDSLTDAELAALSLTGRQAAFGQLVHRHRQAMYRLTRGYTGDADEAMDLTQDTFVAAHQALKSYDPERAFGTWLTTIALNKCRDWSRRRAVRGFLGRVVPMDRSFESIADERVGVEQEVADRQELALVAQSIARLPTALKESLLLRTVEGLSQAEAARVLGISEKAVETRLYRARTRLLGVLGASVEGSREKKRT